MGLLSAVCYGLIAIVIIGGVNTQINAPGDRLLSAAFVPFVLMLAISIERLTHRRRV
jgi:hypothetical protein